MLDVLWWVLKILAAVAAAVVLYIIGAKMVANFSNSEPPPDPGDIPLEDVDYRYKCIVCGAQAVLYAAPEGEVPDPPRHCREPMVLVTPVE
jgi:hypothetical protein